jgi:nicotinamidase-related amidase
MNRTGPSSSALIKREESLLVIIDMQERLVPAVSERERVVENTLRLVRFARIAGLPVLVTEQQKLGDTLPEIREALGGFKPFPKLEFNCFGSGAFAEAVGRLDRGTMILAGVEAHICVAQTALHGVSEYRVQVVSDAVSSRDPWNKEISLRRMEQAGVTVTTTEMVIYELLEKAGTDEFREVLKLVK